MTGISEIRTHFKKEKVKGIDLLTLSKLETIGMVSLISLKNAGWQHIAEVTNIGPKKISILFNEVGIEVTEEEVSEYKKQISLQKVSSQTSPSPGVTITPSATSPTSEADMKTITSQVQPNINDLIETKPRQSAETQRFSEYRPTEDLFEFIQTLTGENPESVLQQYKNEILSSLPLYVPTGARHHVRTWILLLSKKEEGKIPISVTTLNTTDKFADILDPLLDSLTEDVLTEINSDPFLDLAEQLDDPTITNDLLHPEDLINLIKLYKVYTDSKGAEWDNKITDGHLGITENDGKEFEKRMMDISPDFDLDNIHRVWVAFLTGDAVMFAGAPGTGKTVMAKATGEALTGGLWGTYPFTRMNISGGLEPSDLVGEWDYQKQILAITTTRIRLEKLDRLSEDEIDSLRQDIYTADYFNFGPLALAMIQGIPILMDEVNRGSPDIQNILLQAIDEHEIILPSIGRVKASPGFMVIFTINEADVGTTDLGEAFMRRVKYLSFHEPSDYTKWVKQEFPDISETLLKDIEAVRRQIMEIPSLSSQIAPSSVSAWARELITMYGPSVTLNRQRIIATLGTLVKNSDDIAEIEKHIDQILQNSNIPT